ncbi:MHYT domain-containing protein [Methylovirgula sp. HY1]|uniref:MHYT domain-containing protein n=1 Tax=Methylovirgula sp. HY1 TaxID=2822761 RepID=UPI001C5B6F77|nr:MHYT domain-containing protein [Methylovirgula sp. HY1]QXX76246.1 CO-responsive transcriptional regulator RcoM [Methylovirgula sp. HY1]
MTYEPWLVCLSIVMAIQGSYVGLQLAAGLDSTGGSMRKLLLAGSAITLAVGIWSMHFVGMLAAHLPRDIDFVVLPTLISFLTCVIVVGIGVCAVHMAGPQWIRITSGALAMGTGIFLMHYIGMSAVQGSEYLSYNPIPGVLAFVIAVVTSGVALWMLDRTTQPLPIWLAAIVLGIAVSGMHYTAMAGTTFALCVTRPSIGSPVLTRDTLAIVVAVVAFSVSGGFLLSLVPDRRNAERDREGQLKDELRPALESNPIAQPIVSEASSQDQNYCLDTPNFVSTATQQTSAYGHSPQSLTVEKDGRARHLHVDNIRSVRANAHYTYVSDGTQEFFCKLSISAIEAILDPRSFMRVHRSYIVAIDHVMHVQRHGENGIVELAGAPVHCNIPVARARMTSLQRRIEAQRHAFRSGPHAPVHE